MGMTMIEKILARAAGLPAVAPGDVVTVGVETAVVIDQNFMHNRMREPKRVWDPDKVVIMLDHIAPADTPMRANIHKAARKFAEKQGITQFHDVNGGLGICHQLVADYGYALPGSVLACVDSHTCSAGAFNCAARGIGHPEMAYVLATGRTWFPVVETVRYEFVSELPRVLNGKDVILHIANTYGDHAMQNVEFVGPGVAAMSMNTRRTIATMCAEISTEFAVFEADERCIEHVRSRSPDAAFEPQAADADAVYADVRTVDLGALEPLVAFPDTVVRNSRPVSEAANVRIDQAFIGSCANGTLDDFEAAATVLKGRKIARGTRLIVTPGSQAVLLEATRRGYVETLLEAGAVVTNSTCGACCGYSNGVLGAGEVCITASTRNFKGRMGSPEASIYLASPATVAASAVRGFIADPRDMM
ncbi:aconitase/3-isopropylmalate dehydratase large subunit family protein [Futiania mangrovi]|uniref:Aconitase/3-isopropylmalate dehydratase large subunit family protein n=1 Tax=Futiania mangrovi TaxID=2959716 RepID=A0A9J6PGU1_9PROT|nr:aconitase/3-isopropylmalate dehydratase large subunit family protein [Futiania mangrovii]MCP1337040.1 aconitase/3-isopropylmalate dehydratase large subunit family protein [Futiania mangrovii]